MQCWSRKKKTPFLDKAERREEGKVTTKIERKDQRNFTVITRTTISRDRVKWRAFVQECVEMCCALILLLVFYQVNVSQALLFLPMFFPLFLYKYACRKVCYFVLFFCPKFKLEQNLFFYCTA